MRPLSGPSEAELDLQSLNEQLEMFTDNPPHSLVHKIAAVQSQITCHQGRLIAAEADQEVDTVFTTSDYKLSGLYNNCALN